MSRNLGLGWSLASVALLLGCNQAGRTEPSTSDKEATPAPVAATPAEAAAQPAEDPAAKTPMTGTTASGQQIIMTDTMVQPVETIDATPKAPPPAKASPPPAPARPAPKPAAVEPRAMAPAGNPASPGATTASAPASAATGPHWFCEKPVYDFGEVWSGAQVSWTFEYRNDGTETLKILDAKPTCHCTALKNFTRSLEPGESGKITLVVNTNGQANSQSKVIKVQTSDPTQETVSLTMRGFVKTLFSVNPPQGAAFGMIDGKEPLERVVTLTNNTEQPVTLEVLPPTGSKSFTAELQETVPGKEFKVTVKGTPPLDIGSTSTNFRYKTNHDKIPEYTVTANAYVQPRIQVNPPKLVVENPADKDSDWTVRIFNNGAAPLELLSIRTTDVRLKPHLVTVTPGQKQKYELKINIPQGWVPPAYAEMVEITTTDPEYAKIEIPIQPSFRMPSARPQAANWVELDMHTGEPAAASESAPAVQPPKAGGDSEPPHAMGGSAKPGN